MCLGTIFDHFLNGLVGITCHGLVVSLNGPIGHAKSSVLDLVVAQIQDDISEGRRVLEP